MNAMKQLSRNNLLRICLILLIGWMPLDAQNLKITSGTTLTIIGDASLNVQGTFTNEGTFTPGPNTVMTFSGTNESINGATMFTNLRKTGGGTLTLNDPVGITGTLTLDNGLVVLGSNNLSLGDAAVIAGTPSASAMIVTDGSGELRKGFTTTGSFVFPVGDANGTSEYSPVTVNFTAGTFSSAYAAARVVNAKPAQNGSGTHFIDRYWVLSSSGITGFSCDVTCTYVPADVHGMESMLGGGRWDGTQWHPHGTANILTHSFGNSTDAFGEFTAGESGAVPVELVSFSATALDESNVRLRWKTATEVNCFGFDVQRRNAETGHMEWQSIGFALGQGSKYTPTDYVFMDRLTTPLTGGAELQYRLKQIDRDGATEFSPIVSVHFGGRSIGLELAAPYPNPATDRVSISCSIVESVPLTITLHNALGAEVRRVCDAVTLDHGAHVFPVETADLPAGVYVVRLESAGVVRVRKMLLLR